MQKSLVKSKINNLNKPEIKQAWYSTYGNSYEEGLRFLLKSIDSNSFTSENLLEDIKNKKPIQYILGEWDFYTGTMCDLIAVGVIDPVKVTRCALQNAASAAGTLLTTSHAVVG